MMERRIVLEVPLPPTDRAALAAQQAAAPSGHIVLGPARLAPYWVCATCGVSWADGLHPRLGSRRPFAEALAEADAAEAETAEEADRLPWPFGA
jgi:hypothetical protein